MRANSFSLGLLGLAVACVTSYPSTASAAVCATINMRVDATILVVGVDRLTGNAAVCQFVPVVGGYDEHVSVHPACNHLTPAGDHIVINGSNLTGTIAPLIRNIPCDGRVVEAFPPFFSFGFDASGGGGTNFILGTPNDDILASNSSSLDDGANDYLCGFEGDDVIIGDDESCSGLGCWGESMDGGTGYDECHGISSITPAPNEAYKCEVITDASVAAHALCGSSPFDTLPTGWPSA